MMWLVAECGPCNGDLDYALRCVAELAKYRGPHKVAMKVQWYRADSLVTKDALRYDHTSGGGPTQHEIFSAQLSYDDWALVKTAADSAGLTFFPTVFDQAALAAARYLGITMLKIASGDITYHDLIAAAAVQAQHLIISTGASDADEIEAAVEVVDEVRGLSNNKLTLLACHLEYPSKWDRASLGRVLTLMTNYLHRGVDVGYSDHTPNVNEVASVLGVLGASMWEKHFTLTPGAGGDHDFAADLQRLMRMSQHLEFIETMMGNGVLGADGGEIPAREGARRSLVAKVDIPRLTKLNKDMFEVLRPGTGIPPSDLDRITGTTSGGAVTTKPAWRAMVDIPAGTVVTYKMVGLTGATLTVE